MKQIKLKTEENTHCEETYNVKKNRKIFGDGVKKSSEM